MKIKKFNKKLILNKKTVADLKNEEMVTIKGGFETGSPLKCPTYISGCCPYSWPPRCF